MKKRDLLVAGLLLMGLPVLAQPNLSDPQSAKVVFNQNFEASWEDWKSEKIDQITEIQYYVNTGTSDGNGFTPWTDEAKNGDWAKGPIRTDSIIDIFNGEMVVIDDGEKAKGNEEWGDDKPSSSTIVEDNTRAGEFNAFGEADGGGNYYFKFTSDTILKINSGNGAYSNKLAARYRRNLFVRLKPGDIEENSSYRLTFFVKAKTLPGHEDFVATPTVYADVMRGYYHSEKPFSMGYNGDYTNVFEYTKNDFYSDKNWNNWEKVTFMTYYTTDSIAEYFMFKDGYWWADDDAWLWKKGSEGNTVDGDLRYIVQPDKYFVRLGFPADYTEYSVDNISLTKSWIAGCEYYGDKMRVNFGYKNNLGTLVANEKKRTGVDQLEISADNFQVWCLLKDQPENDPNSWQLMPMRSAEYHADGYMYLFTQFFKVGDEDFAVQFQDYDKVLVSFQNPTDPNLQLKYTDAPFPKGNDTTWIKAGKIVPDFVNEVAVPNPTPSIWKGVYSKYDLPPVMTQAPYEEGSFGLAPVSEMKFKFSRKVIFDNTDQTTKALAYVNDEKWTISYDEDNDSILVITRPNGQPLPAGDYIVELSQLYGFGTDEGADVIMHYNFGEVSRNVGTLDNLQQFWSARFDDAANTTAECLPEGTALLVYPSGNETFTVGDGSVRDANCRMYWFAGDYNRAFNFNSRGQDRMSKFYFGVEEGYEINLAKGSYSFNFGVVGINHAKKTTVYIYEWDEAWNTKLKDITKLADVDKIKIAEFTPSKAVNEDIRTNSNTKTLDMLDEMAIQFDITTAGRYVVEFDFNGGFQWSGYDGILFTSPVITARPPVSYLPISALNSSVDNATAKINAANDSLAVFGGKAYESLVAKRDYYNYNPEGGFKPYPTEPSAWAAAKEDLDKYTTALSQRMDTINSWITKLDDANKKLAGLDSIYKQFDVSAILQALVDTTIDLSVFPITTLSGKDIQARTDKVNNAITAVDNRATKNDNLKQLIADAEKEVKAAERADYAEFTTLADTLAYAKAFDAIKSKDEEVDAMSAKLQHATLMYSGKVSAWKAQTQRLKALRDLAAELEIDEVNTWQLRNFVDTTNVDNDEIADIYKAAVKYAISQMIVDGDIEEGDLIDLTPLLKNYNLYATIEGPIVDNTTLQLPGDRNNDAAKAANNQGSTMMRIKHQWGQAALNSEIIVLMFDSAYANVFPGWTVKSFITGNHSMVTPDPTATTEYKYLMNGFTSFDGALTMDWNSKAELKTVADGLPNGYYSLGVTASVDASGSVVTTLQSTTTVNAKDSILKFDVTADQSAKEISVDSIPVLDGKIGIALTLASNDGGSKADDFTLTFLGKIDGVNYAKEATDAKADLDAKIAASQTFVNNPKVAGASVEYYTIGGMKVNAPKAGEIIIRKTTKNGKVVVDKVLVK